MDGSIKGAHPVLVIGIVIFILAVMNGIPGLGWIPGWFKSVGIITILLGAGLSIWKASI